MKIGRKTHEGGKNMIGERRELLLSKGVKREKWDEEMKEKGPHSPYIAAHDPTQQPTNRPGSVPFALSPVFFAILHTPA